MNYLLFNNSIYLSDGEKVTKIKDGPYLAHMLEGIDRASICVVDVDVMIATAMETPVEKKDNLLVRKFKELYAQEEYIIQDEKIDSNLFQVIGIKEKRVREIYALVPSVKVDAFVPYALALRQTLINENMDLSRTIVFVDDFGTERLLTVFDGMKFSRTRFIIDNGEDILPEIKRSQIDFFKKNEEYISAKKSDILVVVNNRSLADEISKGEERLEVKFLDITYPALEGLKEVGIAIKYRLPEEILRQRKEIELKKNITTALVSLSIVAVGLAYFLFYQMQCGLLSSQEYSLKQINTQLEEQLKVLDTQTYREDLKRHKYLNYGISYLAVLDLIPPGYEVNSFKFIKSSHWAFELSLFADNEGPFNPILKIGILRKSEVKDIFINNQPGKHIDIIL